MVSIGSQRGLEVDVSGAGGADGLVLSRGSNSGRFLNSRGTSTFLVVPNGSMRGREMVSDIVG